MTVSFKYGLATGPLLKKKPVGPVKNRAGGNPILKAAYVIRLFNSHSPGFLFCTSSSKRALSFHSRLLCTAGLKGSAKRSHFHLALLFRTLTSTFFLYILCERKRYNSAHSVEHDSVNDARAFRRNLTRDILGILSG